MRNTLVKKILIAIIAITSISVANANMSECTSSTQAKNWNDAVQYCEPLSKNNKDALIFTSWGYTELEKGKQAQKYLQEYINKYAKTESNNIILSNGYTSLGNAYYFGEYGATKNLKKGLEYITKGAELGNATAQEQLGNFYLARGEYPSQNMGTSYKWFKIASINGNQKSGQSYILTHQDSMKKEAPYCLAMGKQLIAIAYINGTGGLSKDKYEAKQYLKESIELYKKGDPSAEELKYCPKQKGLGLSSAEKSLSGL
jgi:exonuclease V gamma subunit